jgi:antitoxin PrlF
MIARSMNMTENEKEPCCSSNGRSCCKVESIVSVDERGQMVLPKDLREKAKIKPGDKLAVVSMERNGKVCCLSLIKTDELEGMVKSVLGPVMDAVFKR